MQKHATSSRATEGSYRHTIWLEYAADSPTHSFTGLRRFSCSASMVCEPRDLSVPCIYKSHFLNAIPPPHHFLQWCVRICGDAEPTSLKIGQYETVAFGGRVILTQYHLCMMNCLSRACVRKYLEASNQVSGYMLCIIWPEHFRHKYDSANRVLHHKKRLAPLWYQPSSCVSFTSTMTRGSMPRRCRQPRA